MRAWLAVVLALLACSATAAPVPKTDVVVLRNGDRLTGEVDKVERGRLTLKTDDVGTVEIEWDVVASVTAAATFDVDDLDGRRYVGSLKAGPQAGVLTVASAADSRTVALSRVASARRLKSTWWRRLDGSLDAGASYQSASSLFTLDMAAALQTERPGWEASLEGNATLTRQPDVEDVSRSSAKVVYARRFEGNWLALVQARLEQNRELGFELRSGAAAGGGRYLVRSQRQRLLTSVGVTVNRERPLDEGESDTATNVEAVAAVAFDRFSYDFPKIDVAISLAGFTSLSDAGRSRLELEASLKRELVRNFYATLRGYESYDSRPPGESTEHDDYGVTFALGWTF